MARHIAADGKELFRAVVTETYTREGEEPRTTTSVYGPYNRTNEPTALITREKNEAARENLRFGPHGWVTKQQTGRAWSLVEVTGKVEKAAVVWVALDDAADVIPVTRAEYESLKEASDVLGRLEAHGVDNWEGYGDALSGRDWDE